jgi:NAD(P)-dependent dehydrogenase (short-subunit alcohol dehydrogenase family)
MSRVAVVTGGSAGLGRAIVRQLAEDGFDVGVLARGQDGLDGTLDDVVARGRRCVAIPTDVSDVDQVEAAAERIERELGPIDVWVNNAMAGVFAEFLDVTPREYDRATAVVYLGFVNGTRAALRRMIPRDRGHIVQIGSALAFRGIPLQSAYCGAKHAMVGFTESVITELLHRKSHVRISMVHMPALNTVQFSWVRSRLPHHPQPVPPIYQPEVGARAVSYVVRHPRRTTWVGAPTVGVILGNRLFPGLLDLYLARTGVKGQQSTDDPHPMLKDNLDSPDMGDHGSHGDFDDRSHDRSAQVWLSEHRTPVLIGGVAAAAGLVGALRRR